MAGLSGRLSGFVGAPGSLRRRSIDSALVSFGGYGSQQALRLGSNLVMTRLLAPEAFGLMALVFTVHAGVQMFSDMGLRGSIIRSDRGETALFLRTAWTIRILRFCAVAAVVALIAAILAGLHWVRAIEGGTAMTDPRLPALLAVSAGIILIQALNSPAIELAERRLQIKRKVALELSAQVAGIATMLAAALLRPDAWALLAGSLVSAVVMAGLSHSVLHGPAMRLAWDRSCVDEIWDFGKWILGSSGLNFLVRQGDRFVFGALLDTRTFGFYAIAVMWVQAITPVVQLVIRQVGQPVFNEAGRDSSSRLQRAFVRFRRLSDALAALGCLVALTIAFVLYERLYPDAYAPAADLMALLAFKVVVLRYQVLTPFALSQGNSRGVFLSELPAATVTLLGTLAAFQAFGLGPAICVSALAGLAAVPGRLKIAAQHVPVNWAYEIAGLFLIAMGGVFWTITLPLPAGF